MEGSRFIHRLCSYCAPGPPGGPTLGGLQLQGYGAAGPSLHPQARRAPWAPLCSLGPGSLGSPKERGKGKTKCSLCLRHQGNLVIPYYYLTHVQHFRCKSSRNLSSQEGSGCFLPGLHKRIRKAFLSRSRPDHVNTRFNSRPEAHPPPRTGFVPPGAEDRLWAPGWPPNIL